MCSIHIVADGHMLIILHEMAVPERGRKVDATVILGQCLELIPVSCVAIPHMKSQLFYAMGPG